MENPQQVKDKPKSRKIWFIVAGVVLACCVILAIGAVFAGPVVISAVQGFMATPSAATPSVGPAAGGNADDVLKTDVWNAILGDYASNKNCTNVTSTKIEVTQAPDSSGVWQENWTVLACGQTEVLNVKFTPSPQGGTVYAISH